MFRYWLLLLVFKTINCDIVLRISRNIDENYTPVLFGVEERVGSKLMLSCDLVTTAQINSVYDDQITWGKATADFRFKNITDLELLAKKKSNKILSMVKQSDINRAFKEFNPLTLEDEGTYFCASLKYMIFEVVYIVVRNNVSRKKTIDDHFVPNLMSDINIRQENLYCNEKMFKCKSNGACINQHYVCDKKPDCKDGSDESYETCKGDPCKDKLQCDDGRCIPMYWCCDRHHDVECNVTYRPSCCQLLSETYEELEYGYVPYNMTQIKSHGTRYIFISLCILATFFSIVLMLLILSKVFLFAKKTSCARNSGNNLFQLEQRTASSAYRTNIPCNYRTRNILTNVRYSTNTCVGGGGGGGSALRGVGAISPADISNGTVDALLILSDDMIRHGYTDSGTDRPPSYSDVMGQLEPPPPYTSQDCLNL